MQSYIRKPIGTSQYDDYPSENDPALWAPVKEPDPVVSRECPVECEIDHVNSKVTVKIAQPSQIHCSGSEIITTELLGKNHHTEMLYEEKDGTPYVLDKDFTGKQRSAKPAASPFEVSGGGPVKIELSYHKKG